jgi:hypothetical protein
VRGLLAEAPFADGPPVFLRSTLSRYEFTDARERARTGAWWRVTRVRSFCPVVVLQDGELVPVEP